MAQSEATGKADIGMVMAYILKNEFPENFINKGLMKQTTVAKIKYFHDVMEECRLFAADIQTFDSCKSNGLSKKFRAAGNKMFAKGLDGMYEAMQLYNQAICLAEPGNGDELALAYGNRSAVLFEWNEYDLCRENIALAKAKGYPKQLIQKMDDRDFQCVTLLNKPKTDKSHSMSKMGPDVPYPSKKGKTAFYKTKKNGKEAIFQMNIVTNPKDDPLVSKMTPSYNYDKYRGEPSLSFEANSEIPFAANCLEVKYNLANGRYIVTNDDLKPGQIIVIENAFIHAPATLDDMYRYTKCANCYKENFLHLIPCPSCTTTMFCSEKCLVESKPYHDIECSISDLLLQSSWMDTLIIRMTLNAYVCFKNADHLSKFFKTYNDNEAQSTPLRFDNDLTEQQKYKQMLGLERTNPATLEDYCKAAYLYHILIKMTKIIAILKTDDHHNTLMELLLRNIRIVPLNAIECFQYKSFDIGDSGFDKLENIYVRGIYQCSSLFKHSCAPNISIVGNAAKMIVYANRPIKKGSQLLRCYGRSHYFENHLSKRQEFLSGTLSLKCQCEACTKKYPARYEDISLGELPYEYNSLLMDSSFLDFQVHNLPRYLEILEKFDYMVSSSILNRVQFTVYKIMKLMYGDISTKLIMTFRKSSVRHEFSDQMIHMMMQDPTGFLANGGS